MGQGLSDHPSIARALLVLYSQDFITSRAGVGDINPFNKSYPFDIKQGQPSWGGAVPQWKQRMKPSV